MLDLVYLAFRSVLVGYAVDPCRARFPARFKSIRLSTEGRVVQ
jgi:hypothetical protein